MDNRSPLNRARRCLRARTRSTISAHERLHIVLWWQRCVLHVRLPFTLLQTTGATTVERRHPTVSSHTNTGPCRHCRRVSPPDESWTDDEIVQELRAALRRIRLADVIKDPFPHYLVSPLLSECFYTDLMAKLPAPSEYILRPYAGTSPCYGAVTIDIVAGPRTRAVSQKKVGAMREPRRLQHYAMPSPRQKFPVSRRAVRAGPVDLCGRSTQGILVVDSDYRLVHSNTFTELLYQKLALPAGRGIHAWKREVIHHDGRAPKNSASFRIDSTSYHLTPHIDKISR